MPPADESDVEEYPLEKHLEPFLNNLTFWVTIPFPWPIWNNSLVDRVEIYPDKVADNQMNVQISRKLKATVV